MPQVKAHGGAKEGVGAGPGTVGAVHSGTDHAINQLQVLRRGKGQEFESDEPALDLLDLWIELGDPSYQRVEGFGQWGMAVPPPFIEGWGQSRGCMSPPMHAPPPPCSSW